MGEHAKTIEQADAQDRGQQRAGEAEHEQQRGYVAEQQVLDHVRVQQLLARLAQPGQRCEDQREAAVEARPAPAGRSLPPHGERAHAPRVEDREDGERTQLQRGLEDG